MNDNMYTAFWGFSSSTKREITSSVSPSPPTVERTPPTDPELWTENGKKKKKKKKAALNHPMVDFQAAFEQFAASSGPAKPDAKGSQVGWGGCWTHPWCSVSMLIPVDMSPHMSDVKFGDDFDNFSSC